MGSKNDESLGPDLSQGIDEGALAGGRLVGHVDGTPVLLIRVDGDVCAVGAKCTHYGGPLVEGLIIGDTIRCPWHHACFDLRSGEMLRPPALSDLPRWTVERQNARIRVTGRDKAKPPRRTPRAAPDSVVILGAGGAGNAAAETLRREGYSGTIKMIDSDPDAPYDRPNLSKDYLAGKAPEEWMPLRSAAFYERNRIEIVRRAAVSLDVKARTVALDDGSTLRWGALLLAPGAEPIPLDVSIETGANVHLLRSLADGRAIVEAARSAERAVVVGAGFIGLEVAASLRQRGLTVQVVGREELPLGKVMGPDIGGFIRDVHEKHGVTFHLGRTIGEIRAGSVVLDDGTALDADLVVVGIGVKPRVRLAEEAGIAVENGFTVNEHLETSCEGIWAAGDAANWPDPRTGRRVRVEHWVLAERMGQAAARNMLGAGRRFDAVPFFWSQHYDDVVSYVGHGAGWDESVLDGEPANRDCAVTFRRNGKRIAVATLSRDTQSLETEAELEREIAHVST
jgi:apoptosis-inducing factor 3